MLHTFICIHNTNPLSIKALFIHEVKKWLCRRKCVCRHKCFVSVFSSSVHFYSFYSVHLTWIIASIFLVANFKHVKLAWKLILFVHSSGQYYSEIKEMIFYTLYFIATHLTSYFTWLINNFVYRLDPI